MAMTKKKLRDLCEKNGLYRTPRVNDRIYLHYQGFKKIENLEEYSGVKVIWAECNAISKIENLEKQTALRSLFLHQNCITKIEGLENLVELDCLNLSKNLIKRVENLAVCKKLTNLNLGHNLLRTVDDILELKELKALRCLDLQHNRIEETAVKQVILQCKTLNCLYLQQNPCAKSMKNYRKTIVFKLPNLTFLDNMPIFDLERMKAVSYMNELEKTGDTNKAAARMREETQKYHHKKSEMEKNNRSIFWELVKGAAELKRADTDKENLQYLANC